MRVLNVEKFSFAVNTTELICAVNVEMLLIAFIVLNIMLSVLVYTLSMRAVAEFENVSYATLKKFEVFAMLLSRILRVF
jgi:hypothetical protein